MAGFGLEHLLDPLVGGDLLSAILPLFWERQDQQSLRNDPNILNYINGRIGEYNAQNAYNPETGQYHAGSPFGDPASGNGGAYGHDANGNPYSPFQANSRYNLSQLQGSQAGLDAGLGNLGRVAQQAGVASPQGYSLNVPQGLNPDAMQGVDQSVRTPPPPMFPLSPRQSPMEQFLGSFAVGTSSIPQEGFAYLHQGEAVVPRQQNPGALPPGVPGAPLAAGPQRAPNGGLMPPPAPPQAGGMLPPPRMAAAPTAPQYAPMQPGLNAGVQNQIVQRGREGIDREYQGLGRQLRNAAPAGGGGGAMERRLFDAELARRGELSGLTRDVGIEAGNRQFTDTLAMNDQLMNRFLGEGNMANTSRGLDIQERLGLGNEQTTRRGQDIQEALGRLGLGNDARGLDIQERQGTAEIELRRMLGLEGENTARRGQDIQDTLGRLGLGNDARGLDIQERQGQDEIALRRLLGLEGENTARRGQDIQQGLGQGDLDLRRLLGQEGENTARRGQDIQSRLGEGEINLRRMLGLEGEETTRRGQTMQDAISRLGLQNDARGLGIQERLGLGNLENDRYGLETNRNLGQGELGRNLANDAFGQYQWGQNRNDQLSQQDFQNQLQQLGLSQNSTQFADLMALLGQGFGTAGGGAGNNGGGFQPLGGFFQNLLGGGGSATGNNGGSGSGGGGNGFQPLGGLFQNLLGGGGSGGGTGNNGGGFQPLGGFFQQLFGLN